VIDPFGVLPPHKGVLGQDVTFPISRKETNISVLRVIARGMGLRRRALPPIIGQATYARRKAFIKSVEYSNLENNDCIIREPMMF
jgi:hypothetical protein